MDSLLALLRCPIGPHTLHFPSTLKCGHSICASHLTDDRCPVPGCVTAAPTPPNIPSTSRVAFYPAPAQIPVPATIPPVPDVTLSKIITLLTPPTDDDLLSHIRTQSARARAVPANQPLPDDNNPLHKELLSELSCEICFMLLYSPVTTPCQHTFCARCLQRSLDHSTVCPLCRQDLPTLSYFLDHPQNKTILAILLHAFPSQYADRAIDDRDLRLDTPIFVCQLSFPGMPTLLHFFEPRYRLMLRRCLESPRPAFGMIIPGPAVDYGTMLEIRSVQMLPDGRSMVETWGTHRFRILEKGVLDGYMVARIERVDDYPDELDNSPLDDDDPPPDSPLLSRQPSPPTNAALMDTCLAFLAQLRQGTAPWVVQRLNHTYGPMPADPARFSFWVTLILPIDEREKAKLLPIRSPRARMRLVVFWIEMLRANWWFSTRAHSQLALAGTVALAVAVHYAVQSLFS